MGTQVGITPVSIKKIYTSNFKIASTETGYFEESKEGKNYKSCDLSYVHTESVTELRSPAFLLNIFRRGSLGIAIIQLGKTIQLTV